MQKFIQDDVVSLDLKMNDIQPTDKTNSVTYEVEYDGDTFEPVNNDVNTAVVDGYIPFNSKLDVGQGANKKLVISYLDMNNDIPLQDGAKVLTANFRVKQNPTPGIKTFTLKPVEMLDSDGKVYNVNDDNPVTTTVDVTNDAVVEGYVNLYMGDDGSGLNTSVLGSLNQVKINDTLNNLKFTLKHDTLSEGTVLNGSDLFIPDENGNLGVKDANNKISGKFRIYTQDTANTLLKIDGVGYLKKELNLTLNLGQVFGVGSEISPLEIYPGDVGQIVNRQLLLTPDGKITNVDFSAWLKLYKLDQNGTGTPEDQLRADFTKDGVIDNVDFTLWLASYRKVLSLGL